MGLSVSVEVWIISVVGHWTLDTCVIRDQKHTDNFPSQIEIFADFFTVQFYSAPLGGIGISDPRSENQPVQRIYKVQSWQMYPAVFPL